MDDYENSEWFFAPEGRIPDNTTTSKTLSYFDADLVDQADYILEQLPTIPAGVGITSYQGSMVVWGEDANQSTVRVSKAGEPESFNAVEGFTQVEPANGGGVRNCRRVQILPLHPQSPTMLRNAGDGSGSSILAMPLLRWLSRN